MDKRGQSRRGTWIPIAVFVVLAGAVWAFAAWSSNTEGGTNFTFDQNLKLTPIGFEEVLGGGGAFKFFNYIFGKIPGYLPQLIDSGEGDNTSAAIITIAIWVMFLAIFLDIFRVFSFFDRKVSALIAVLMTVIMANIKGLAFITVYFLSLFAILGAFAIVASIGMVIGLFIFFHFGGQSVRAWIQARRADDLALRAEVAAGEAKAGLRALRLVGEEAGRRH